MFINILNVVVAMLVVFTFFVVSKALTTNKGHKKASRLSILTIGAIVLVGIVF